MCQTLTRDLRVYLFFREEAMFLNFELFLSNSHHFGLILLKVKESTRL